MQQEINLYLLLPQKKKSFLNLKFMAFSYGLFILILALHFCVEEWGKHKASLAAEALNLELSAVQQKMAAIHEQYPMLDPKDMENSLKKLQQELEEKNNIFNLLLGDRNFSTYLVGVAKAAVPGLWLVDIRVEMDKKNIILKGYAQQSKDIQQFMNNLALQKEFSGLNFQLKDVIKVVQKKETLLDFTISSQVGGENET